jgi:hypothetical protein
MAITEQRLFDQGSAALNIAAKHGDRMCSLRKRERIICAKLRCVACQSHSIRDFPRAISEPAVRLALDVTVSSQAVGWSEFGINLYRAAEKPERLGDTYFRPLIKASYATECARARIQDLVRRVLCVLNLKPLQLGTNCADDLRGQLILESEDVVQLPVEVVRPYVSVACDINQVGVDAHPTCRFMHLPAKQVTHSWLLTNVSGPPGISSVGTNSQPGKPGENACQIFNKAGGKAQFCGVLRNVRKRKNGYRGLIEKEVRRSLWARLQRKLRFRPDLSYEPKTLPPHSLNGALFLTIVSDS